jgi:ABC-type transporter Mla subunit MlaD
MKHLFSSRSLAMCALAALPLILAGCASPDYDQGSKTASGLKESAAKIEATQAKLDQTLAALNDLVNNPKPDLRPQYKKFSSGVDEVESLAEHVSSSVQSMSARSKEFMDQWSAQLAEIKNEDIHKRSEVRQREVTAALTKVKQRYAEAQANFQPFMSDLRDIQKYLGTDLTQAGVAGMRSTAAKANVDAASLKKSVDNLITEFKALGVSMSASNPAPPK